MLGHMAYELLLLSTNAFVGCSKLRKIFAVFAVETFISYFM